MFWARFLLAVLAGVLLALCFAPFEWTSLMWVAVGMLLVSLWMPGSGKKEKRDGFRLGYVMGLVFWSINLKWLSTVATPAPFFIAPFLALYQGVFGWLAAGAGNPWLVKKEVAQGVGGRFREALRSLEKAAICGGAWAGLEWVRGWFLTGFGWNGLGVTFHDTLVLAQAAEWVGVYGLSFLPVFFVAVILQSGRRVIQQAGSGVRFLHWDFAVAMIVMAGLMLAGSVRMGQLRSGEMKEVRVLLVQQNIPQSAHQVFWEGEKVYAGYEELTTRAVREIRERGMEEWREMEGEPGEEIFHELKLPDLIIWPEATLGDRVLVTEDGQWGVSRETELLFEAIREESLAKLLVGVNVVEGERQGDFLVQKEGARHWNSLLVSDVQDGYQAAHKIHLVPFGEYVPDIGPVVSIYEKVTRLEHMGDFSRGGHTDPLEVVLGSEVLGLIPTICFEDTVPRVTRKFVRDDGPQAIVNVTNDGWFHQSEAAKQHYHNALFRTIELRRPMVRCANTGVSGVVSLTGSPVDPVSGERRVLLDEKGSHFTRDWLFASMWVPKKPVVTLYAKFGDWFSVLGLLASLAGWVRWRFFQGKGRRFLD